MNVRVCFKCKHYTTIHPGNPMSVNRVLQFDFLHFKHPVQTIDRKELPKDFEWVKL